ncbi:hypothetical protein P7K49_004638 [Saguinus oedipus]|uniref:IF rod domain-containing protein n=1 Tax=Saguinus oedipus TaxID=9490 RepID=A0ABQ9W805_SAGOE|nr:hypothetical protein P7K49_004638 [Saguinus oedipus]
MGGILYKETMQSLNDHLASYLDRVRGLGPRTRGWRAKSRSTWTRRDPRAGHVPVFGEFHGLCKVIDDTSVTQLQLERDRGSQGRAVLHEGEPQRGIKRPTSLARSGLIVEVDAPKYQDLAKIIADIQAQYNKLAQKNQEELDKYWSQQIEESTRVVTM